ncbi:hypothetical protein Pmani_021022 [Petrolisthes manimaculis]|uniref:Ig-like domain-containing protein n=1 Tax=Petrolisthes manimaculis TaxID=1843537 RepID=A0AAE1PHJ4_9EUCA|nr:hypothetical protein Pmani_021022 [Petrolisthes manimaculis]
MIYLCKDKIFVAATPFRGQWFERHVPGYPRYYYAGDPELGEHHLVISGVTLTEDGEYQCQVGPTMSTPPIWASANVTVISFQRTIYLPTNLSPFLHLHTLTSATREHRLHLSMPPTIPTDEC